MRKNNGIRNVSPKTRNQKKWFEAYSGDNDVIVIHGCPGSGKSFLALYSALSDVLNGEYSGLTIIRSAVPAREIGIALITGLRIYGMCPDRKIIIILKSAKQILLDSQG